MTSSAQISRSASLYTPSSQIVCLNGFMRYFVWTREYLSQEIRGLVVG